MLAGDYDLMRMRKRPKPPAEGSHFTKVPIHREITGVDENISVRDDDGAVPLMGIGHDHESHVSAHSAPGEQLLYGPLHNRAEFQECQALAFRRAKATSDHQPG
jgi:hypothetical protein